jgi:hypothetical protein
MVQPKSGYAYWMEMSKWDYVKADFLIMESSYVYDPVIARLSYYDRSIDNNQKTLGETSVTTGVSGAMSAWKTLTFPIADMVGPQANFAMLDSARVIGFYLPQTSQAGVKYVVYMDNVRLARDESSLPPPWSPPTGISVVQKQPDMIVYPNPSKNQILLNGVKGKVSFYDTSGMKILDIRDYKEGNTINVSRLHAGLYIIETPNGIMKFIKK